MCHRWLVCSGPWRGTVLVDWLPDARVTMAASCCGVSGSMRYINSPDEVSSMRTSALIIRHWLLPWLWWRSARPRQGGPPGPNRLWPAAWLRCCHTRLASGPASAPGGWPSPAPGWSSRQAAPWAVAGVAAPLALVPVAAPVAAVVALRGRLSWGRACGGWHLGAGGWWQIAEQLDARHLAGHGLLELGERRDRRAELCARHPGLRPRIQCRLVPLQIIIGQHLRPLGLFLTPDRSPHRPRSCRPAPGRGSATDRAVSVVVVVPGTQGGRALK